MPLIISKKENHIPTEAVCFNDGPFADVLYEKKGGCYEIHAGEPLRSFYLNCLEQARELGLSSLSMPLLPQDCNTDVFRIASDTIREFLDDNEMDVYLLVEDKEAILEDDSLHADIRDYLDRNLPAKRKESVSCNTILKEKREKPKEAKADKQLSFRHSLKKPSYYPETDIFMELMMPDMEASEEYVRFIPDESFSECLIRMIDERGMTDPEVYKKANIDRKHFNHIKNTRNYRPKKKTAVALAIGMKLDMNETNTLLERAGFVLSRSSKFDLIIRYCIEGGIYDIFKINEILFREDQELLGC